MICFMRTPLAEPLGSCHECHIAHAQAALSWPLAAARRLVALTRNVLDEGAALTANNTTASAAATCGASVPQAVSYVRSVRFRYHL